MTKRTRENAVYITQLPQDITEEKLGELFGSIGIIKVGGGRKLVTRSIFRFTPAVCFFPMPV